MTLFNGSWMFYLFFGLSLFLYSFGVSGFGLLCSVLLCFSLGFIGALLKNGHECSKQLFITFHEKVLSYRFSPGIERFLAFVDRFQDRSCYEQEHSMSQSKLLDPILEQILGYITRDFIDSWYGLLSNDLLFKESFKRCTRRTVAAFSHCIRKVDFVPLLTQHFVDDFASHLRLYRKAKEKSNNAKCKTGNMESDLETTFFDLELEMEKCYCRDLISTTPQYENAYLHDLVDVILYLLMPSEDFRSRPLRFLLREIVVCRIILPLTDKFTEPDYINHIIVWLLSEGQLRPEDFIATVEKSNDVEELDAVLEAINDEKACLRAKDTGGDQAIFVKQQLASIGYLEGIVKRRMERIGNAVQLTQEFDLVEQEARKDTSFVQLPIHVILTNNVAIMYFADFLSSVGGQSLIDCYLAIEGFKASVEHHIRNDSAGGNITEETYETIKEAANFLYQQYLSNDGVTRGVFDETITSRFLSRMNHDEPPDCWFEPVQDKIMEILKTDEHFYPAFLADSLYLKMLAELGIGPDDNESDLSRAASSCASGSERETKQALKQSLESEGSCNSNSDESGLRCVYPLSAKTHQAAEGIHVKIETLGIGQQASRTFALYNVRVSRFGSEGKIVSRWNIIRRYSDFHTFHSVVLAKFPKLSNISFPGKKAFNNLDSRFLEGRTRALNIYMMNILKRSVLDSCPGLDDIVFNFLSQKEYSGEREALPKKVFSAMFNPIRQGALMFGNAVTSVPDSVFDGVSRFGDGLNRAAKTIIGSQQGSVSSLNYEEDSDRVAAVINEQQWMDNIPLRVLVLFVDEVFGVRARNAWFRRRLVALLRQFVHAALGSSINRKIVDLVQWLTSEQQVAQYIVAFRDAIWPGGQLSDGAVERPHAAQMRTAVLARALILSSLPDELRLFIGAETTNAGIANIFESLQNRHLNRRLFYVILERFIITLFPENRFDRIFPLLHSKSPRSKIFSL